VLLFVREWIGVLILGLYLLFGIIFTRWLRCNFRDVVGEFGTSAYVVIVMLWLPIILYNKWRQLKR
jgi:hypothetical protein